jgi:hypothetical protein
MVTVELSYSRFGPETGTLSFMPTEIEHRFCVRLVAISDLRLQRAAASGISSEDGAVAEWLKAPLC